MHFPGFHFAACCSNSRLLSAFPFGPKPSNCPLTLCVSLHLPFYLSLIVTYKGNKTPFLLLFPLHPELCNAPVSKIVSRKIPCFRINTAEPWRFVGKGCSNKCNADKAKKPMVYTPEEVSRKVKRPDKRYETPIFQCTDWSLIVSFCMQIMILCKNANFLLYMRLNNAYEKVPTITFLSLLQLGRDFIQKLWVSRTVEFMHGYIQWAYGFMYIHYYFMCGICLCTCTTYHCCELSSISCPSLFWVGPRESMWELWRSAGLSPESHATEFADLLHRTPSNSFWSAKNKKKDERAEITQAEYNSARAAAQHCE